MLAGTRLWIRGGDSNAAIGAPRDATILSTTGLVAVIDYDPAELVLTVRAGTPLAAVEALVAIDRRMLAFEPSTHGRAEQHTPKLQAPMGIAHAVFSVTKKPTRWRERTDQLKYLMTIPHPNYR